jgi:hypothetical protein
VSTRLDRTSTTTELSGALRLLGLGLVLYLAFGKGFAYAGIPPVFVGEVLLAVVLVAALSSDTPLPRNAAAAITAVLVGLALVQLTVDRVVGADPWLESVRGLAPIYYSGFAFAVYALLRRQEIVVGPARVMELVDGGVARAAPVVVVIVFLLVLRTLVGSVVGPTWPISGGPLLLAKATDIAVTLVIVLPALLARPPTPGAHRHRRLYLVLWTAAAVVVTFRSRGSLGGLVAGYAVASPHLTRMLRGMLAVAALLAVLYTTGWSVTIGQKRELSFRSGVESVASLVGDDGSENTRLSATRNWRVEWWGEIWDDVTDKQMLFHGYGWGDNLAIRYDILPPGSDRDPRVLRAPHSIFFSLAGRAGLVTAVGFLSIPVLTLVRSFRRQGRATDSPAVQGARAGVAAAVVVAFSDVYLESPQGGIVLWCLIGFLWWVAAPRDDPDATSAGTAQAPVPHRRPRATSS